MGKFDGILICTDLDGTLYKTDKTISAENTEAIEYFKREGGYFTFITGRMPYYSKDAYGKVNPNVPFGCINGGGLFDGASNKFIVTCELNREFVELVEAVESRLPNVGIQVCCLEQTYFAKENNVMAGFRKITGVPNLVRGYRDVDEPVAKILFGSSIEEEITELEKILKAHPLSDSFEFIRSERTLFEILPKGINKGVALTNLIKHLGISAEKTIAIGDYNNDIGMFRVARYGIAVANACAAAREAADLITVSNNDHAIAQVIYDIEQGNIKF